ncbi:MULTISPECIES: DUF429 domain-containing protein [Paenibacillus]|uniref:DUF429 domain-containing protein n=1 Tax=Paenibacillus TaxID=44249 RepID=UPI0022B8EF92|nr:DUF429 domain-containing protein [Paenibacillus caseinilyticus]MCZ8518982.1 DUF429 domain-containing protein [Paenibacillus caseinilyticus]
MEAQRRTWERNKRRQSGKEGMEEESMEERRLTEIGEKTTQLYPENACMGQELGAGDVDQEKESTGTERKGCFAGVDGCPGGWVAIELGSGGRWRGGVYPELEELWESYAGAEMLLIDMPIGLPEGPEPRPCDGGARRLLKPWRASSIFPAPVRGVLAAASYTEANRSHRELSGRGLSRQSWALVPKIRELDALLQREPAAGQRIFEAHPELSFAGLAGAPMRSRKKTAEGFTERMEVLRGFLPEADLIVAELMARYPRKLVARDDIVDALVLAAAAAAAGSRERLSRVPEADSRDATGLPMAIVYYAAEGQAAHREDPHH